MGDDRYHTAFQRGCDLSEQAAVDYALETATATAADGRRQVSGDEADLTPRESQIAKLVSEGLTNREIAARLVIAPPHGRGTRPTHPHQARVQLTRANRRPVRQRTDRSGSVPPLSLTAAYRRCQPGVGDISGTVGPVSVGSGTF